MFLDPVDLTSDLIFVNIYLVGRLCFYGFHGQNKPKTLQNLFHSILNTLSIKKQTPKQKSKVVKDRGGGRFEEHMAVTHVTILQVAHRLLQVFGSSSGCRVMQRQH